VSERLGDWQCGGGDVSGVRDKRSYDQQCGLALALDVVGERWTLLVIRELLVRPRRYRELLDALPGIGTNLLAERLKALEDAGLVQRIDPDRRTGGYALTDRGEELRDAVVALARFGLDTPYHPQPATTPVTRASWAVLAVEALTRDAKPEGVDESFEFHIDTEVFALSVSGDAVAVRSGPATDPVLHIATDAATFFDIGMRRVDPVEALLDGRVVATGPASAVPRCLRLLGLAAPLPGAARPGAPAAAPAAKAAEPAAKAAEPRPAGSGVPRRRREPAVAEDRRKAHVPVEDQERAERQQRDTADQRDPARPAQPAHRTRAGGKREHGRK
jgi:DNA-binding HxlR family transcriptional regulator